MATIPVISDSGRSRLRTLGRWAATLAALGLVLAIGGALGFAHQAVLDHGDALSSAVRTRWAQGGIGPLWQATLLLTLLLLWRIGRKAALFGAFFVVERGLSGPPVDKQAFRFALAVQLTLTTLYAVAAICLLFAPFPAMPRPVLNLGQTEVESLLGPLAPVAIALASLLVYDFCDYWVHRAQHRFAFLWRFHAMHHSVEHLDSLNSYSHPIDVASSTIVFILVSLWIGFTFETMLLFLAFQTIHDRLLHTRAPVNFGILGAVLVDNRTHFLHHDRLEARSGKNFAGTFTIFDRLFGTYERPDPRVLAATGLERQRPPATIVDFFLARPGGRQSSGTVVDANPSTTG